jgi:hypothetical protein
MSVLTEWSRKKHSSFLHRQRPLCLLQLLHWRILPISTAPSGTQQPPSTVRKYKSTVPRDKGETSRVHSYCSKRIHITFAFLFVLKINSSGNNCDKCTEWHCCYHHKPKALLLHLLVLVPSMRLREYSHLLTISNFHLKFPWGARFQKKLHKRGWGGGEPRPNKSLFTSSFLTISFGPSSLFMSDVFVCESWAFEGYEVTKSPWIFGEGLWDDPTRNVDHQVR